MGSCNSSYQTQNSVTSGDFWSVFFHIFGRPAKKCHKNLCSRWVTSVPSSHYTIFYYNYPMLYYTILCYGYAMPCHAMLSYMIAEASIWRMWWILDTWALAHLAPGRCCGWALGITPSLTYHWVCHSVSHGLSIYLDGVLTTTKQRWLWHLEFPQ